MPRACRVRISSCSYGVTTSAWINPSRSNGVPHRWCLTTRRPPPQNPSFLSARSSLPTRTPWTPFPFFNFELTTWTNRPRHTGPKSFCPPSLAPYPSPSQPWHAYPPFIYTPFVLIFLSSFYSTNRTIQKLDPSLVSLASSRLARPPISSVSDLPLFNSFSLFLIERDLYVT